MRKTLGWIMVAALLALVVYNGYANYDWVQYKRTSLERVEHYERDSILVSPSRRMVQLCSECMSFLRVSDGKVTRIDDMFGARGHPPIRITRAAAERETRLYRHFFPAT